eukprot:5277112-Pyramimonas_sp.AAC.1
MLRLQHSANDPLGLLTRSAGPIGRGPPIETPQKKLTNEAPARDIFTTCARGVLKCCACYYRPSTRSDYDCEPRAP